LYNAHSRLQRDTEGSHFSNSFNIYIYIYIYMTRNKGECYEIRNEIFHLF
jgi:hypothetical protein